MNVHQFFCENSKKVYHIRMRIIFLPGIFTPKKWVKAWRTELQEAFPRSDVIIMDEKFYNYLQHEVIESVVQETIQIVDDGVPTTLISHSFGGILAKAVISRSKKSNITALITMASPHTYRWFGVQQAKEYIRSPESVTTPSISFGGYLDIVVPFFFSRIAKEKHQNIWCFHLSFLLSKNVRKKVLQRMQTFLIANER